MDYIYSTKKVDDFISSKANNNIEKLNINNNIINNNKINPNKQLIKIKLNNNQIYNKCKVNNKNIFLIYMSIFILLNVNGILCESYIIVKFNKSGHFKFLFKGGINDESRFCYGAPKHTPNSIYINDALINDNSIDEYDFGQPVNTIKLVYDDTKESYLCLFNECSDIDEIDASHLITSNVNDMGQMFRWCKSLTSLDLINFNTANVKSMHGMFDGCDNLKYLDIHTFDTSNVDRMGWMFCDCFSLESLDIINFNTAKVVDMRIMFGNCISLTTLDLTHFDTSSVTDMGYMFYYCIKLTSIDLSSFNTISTKEFDCMFHACVSLESLKINNFNTHSAINMRNMFAQCQKLISLDLSNFVTENAKNMTEMFSGCTSLESLVISNFDTSQVTDMSYMFSRCHSLTTINLGSFQFNKVLNISNLFEQCNNLKSIDLSNLRSSSIIKMNSIFMGCNSLESVDLSNFEFPSSTEMNNMFTGCSNLKYVNLQSLIFDENKDYTQFIDNTSKNRIICIDNEQTLNKIVSLYQCQPLEDTGNWGEYKDSITNNDNIYTEGCLLSKYNPNCYQICSFYHYFDENININKYICTEDLKCPEPYSYLIHDQNECIKSCSETDNHKYQILLGKVCLVNCPNNFYEPDDRPKTCIPKCPEDSPFLLINSLECVSHCTIKQRQDQLCVTYYIYSKEVNYHIFDEVISQTRNELLNSFDVSVVNGGIINEDGDNITITRTQKENMNDDGIYLGECEDRLKGFYNIPSTESLYVLRIDLKQVGYQGSSLDYEILYPIYDNRNLVILDLSICAGLNINRTRNAKMKGNKDKYDKNSAYYNDICYLSDSENGVDMVLSDKKEDFINNNLGICENGCELLSYNYETEKAVCSCGIKTKIPLMNEMKIDKDTLLNSFTNIDNIMNIKLMMCYNAIFKKNDILKNIGFDIFAGFILLNLVCLLFFIIKDYKMVIKELNKIKSYILNKKKNKSNNIITNNFRRNRRLKSNINNIRPNLRKRINNNFKNKTIMMRPKIKRPPKTKKIISRKNNYLKQKSFIKGKNLISNNNSKSYNFFLINNRTKSNKKKCFKNIKNISYIILNYNEMNNLEFQVAVNKDKRSYMQYYTSLLRTKHSILYIFYTKDYNSKIVKASIQIFDLATLLSINSLFFNDSTMHKIYVDQGKFNILYQLPQIIYSTIISAVLNMLIQLLGLTEDNILKYKDDKSPLQNWNKKYNKLKTIIRVKFILFYILDFLLLFVYWYYVTCFCGIYRNTQIHLLQDSLYSFVTSLITPFCIYLIPGLFRICALKRKSKLLYGFSKILQML